MNENITPAALLDIRNVTKDFPLGSGTVSVLQGINLQVQAGEFVAIVGPSGNGKSTLLNIITGIDRPTRGEVFMNGMPVHTLSEEQLAIWRGKQVGIVFQFFQLLPALNLLQNVILPMDFLGTLPAKQRKERAMRLLELVGLADQAGKLPGTVSGGQQQRAAIARALANDPPLIVADEPTGNLDASTSDDVFNLFSHLVDQGKTLIMVTHNEELACQVPRRVVVHNGMITQDGKCDA